MKNIIQDLDETKNFIINFGVNKKICIGYVRVKSKRLEHLAIEEIRNNAKRNLERKGKRNQSNGENCKGKENKIKENFKNKFKEKI